MPNHFLRSVARPSRHIHSEVHGPAVVRLRTWRPESRTERLEWLLCRIDPWVGYGIVALAGFLVGWWFGRAA